MKDKTAHSISPFYVQIKSEQTPIHNLTISTFENTLGVHNPEKE